MAGQNNNADAELNEFFESLDPLLDGFLLEHHQQVPAAQVDVEPDLHLQMVVDLHPAMQLPQQQAPHMIYLQYPQPARAVPVPPQHQQMIGESPATMPRHPRHHMMSELMLIRPPRYQQAMMGKSSATVPVQQQEMTGKGDPLQAVMTDQHQQMLVDPPVTYRGGEGHFFATAPHDTDGDLGLGALRIEDEEEHLPGGGGNTGSLNVASITRLRNQEDMPEYVADIIERMRIFSTSTGNSPPVDASVAPPPAHRWEERDIIKSGGLRQPNPSQVTVLRMPQQQQGRGASRTEDDQEETRRYVCAAAAEAKKELKTHYPLLKKLSRKNEDLHLKYRCIAKVNAMIHKCEKGSRRHVGSQLSKIRREVEKYLAEKRGLYVKFRELVVKETGSCHDLPPCRNDDEAGPSGGSGAAGAAVA